MDEILSTREPRSRLLRFLRRPRTRRDREFLETFSNPDKPRDEHAADRAATASRERTAREIFRAGARHLGL
jgi:hypothetical protein